MTAGGFDSFSGDDLFDDIAEDVAPARASTQILQAAKRGDVLRVGSSLWRVESTTGVTVYVVRVGTKGKNLYTILPEEGDSVSVRQVSGASGEIMRGVPLADEGPISVVPA